MTSILQKLLSIQTPNIHVANGNVMNVIFNQSKYIPLIGKYYLVFSAVCIHYTANRDARIAMFRFELDDKELTAIAPVHLIGQTENSTTVFDPVYWANGWFNNPVAITGGNRNVWTNGVFLAQKAN